MVLFVDFHACMLWNIRDYPSSIFMILKCLNILPSVVSDDQPQVLMVICFHNVSVSVHWKVFIVLWIHSSISKLTWMET